MGTERKGVMYMLSRAEIKERGKANFKANYWKSVLCAFILSLLVGGMVGTISSNSRKITEENQQQFEQHEQDDSGQVSISSQAAGPGVLAAIGLIAVAIVTVIVIILAVSFLLKILVFNPLQVGCYAFFRENAETADAGLDLLKAGFDNYGHSLATMLLRDVFLVLWSMLFVIPGIVKAYSYRMVPFIIRDNPELTSTEAITMSRDIMRGHKWETFIFDLSFLGWGLLGLLTFNLVNIFWTNPYKENANAVLYLELSENA